MSNAQVALLAAGAAVQAPGVIGLASSTPSVEAVLDRAGRFKVWLDDQDAQTQIADQTYTRPDTTQPTGGPR